MSDSDDRHLDDLARRIAEGEEVDWETGSHGDTDEDHRDAVRGLRVLANLAAVHREALAAPSMDPTAEARTLASPQQTMEFLGPYRLLERIGEGGMGEVWLAEQTTPVRRRVALKIIKRGMDSDRIVARFEAERQALALMDHPSIARVLDAGQTPSGRPYFAMEYVKGLPITDYCDRHRLRMRERLELFIQVCAGVQHAHQKAVIHRDLKPANILVAIQDEMPVPKIIDFGVVKALEQPLTERTIFTEHGTLIGTPEYMSPEQAEMSRLDVDTRTDVYSLGVLLYELLTGVLPFDPRELRAAGFDEIRRKIREEEPYRPSRRLSTLGDKSGEFARCRQADVRTLVRRLAGDLDWITMKALEKDRTRRYPSASELAADIRRHLDHEPVTAGRPGPAYRVGKFVRRHPVGTAVAIGAMVMLVVVGVLLVELVRSRFELRAYEIENRFLDAVYALSDGRYEEALADFGRVIELDATHLEARLGRVNASLHAGGSPVAIHRALDDLDAVARDHSELVAVAELRARLEQIGDQPGAARRDRALAVSGTPRVAIDHQSLGDLARFDGDLEAAVRHYDEALRKDPQLAWSLLHRGLCLRRLKQDDRARVDFEVLSRVWPRHKFAHNNLANTLADLGLFDDALASYDRALDIDPGDATVYFNRARTLDRAGRTAEAERAYRVTLDLDPAQSGALNGLGRLLHSLGRNDEALAAFTEAVRVEESRTGGPNRTLLLNALTNLCDVALAAQNPEMAAPHCGRALELAPEDPDSHYNLATLRMLEGDRDGALAALERDVELGDDDHQYLADDEVFAPLRDDPRFRALLKRMRGGS